MESEDLTHKILNAAYKVHSVLGPGLLESAYRKCLVYELKKRDLEVEEEVPLPLVYEEIRMECGYRMDIVVEDEVVIEIKSVHELGDIHTAQMITYLKLSHNSVGLLINFNVKSLSSGIRRVMYTSSSAYVKKFTNY